MDGKVGLLSKGHFALASLPFTSRPKALRSVVAAKAIPKLETQGKKKPKSSFSEKKIDPSKVDFAAIASKIFSVKEIDIERKSSPRSPKKKIDLSVIDNPSKDAAVVERSNMTSVTLSQTSSMDFDTNTTVSETSSGEESDEEGFNMDFNEEDDATEEGVILDLHDEEDDANQEGAIMDEEKEEQEEEEDIDEDMEMFVPPGVVMTEEKPLRRLRFSNIYVNPYAKNSRVKQAEFVKSSPSVTECPSLKLPEFAMVGRSNVGKSSLINSLVQRKNLAQTSKTPGKTQLINHYIINSSWYLVDLPGYGYAKVPASIRASWDGFTREFFLQSKSLVCVMLLIDGSIPPQERDVQYATWLHQNKVPFTLVFTKCDRKKKRKNGGRRPVENVKDFVKLVKDELGQTPPWIMTSCVTNQGKDALMMHMAQLRYYWKS